MRKLWPAPCNLPFKSIKKSYHTWNQQAEKHPLYWMYLHVKMLFLRHSSKQLKWNKKCNGWLLLVLGAHPRQRNSLITGVRRCDGPSSSSIEAGQQMAVDLRSPLSPVPGPRLIHNPVGPIHNLAGPNVRRHTGNCPVRPCLTQQQKATRKMMLLIWNEFFIRALKKHKYHN